MFKKFEKKHKKILKYKDEIAVQLKSSILDL